MDLIRKLLAFPFYISMIASSPLAFYSQFTPFFLMFGGRLIIPVQTAFLFPFGLFELLYKIMRGK